VLLTHKQELRLAYPKTRQELRLTYPKTRQELRLTYPQTRVKADLPTDKKIFTQTTTSTFRNVSKWT
jgi:hypothetical protein